MIITDRPDRPGLVDSLERNGHKYFVGEKVIARGAGGTRGAVIIELEDRGDSKHGHAAVVVYDNSDKTPAHVMLHQLTPAPPLIDVLARDASPATSTKPSSRRLPIVAAGSTSLVLAPRITTLSRTDVEQARHVLEQARDLATVKQLTDQASTLEHWIKQRGASLEAQSAATELLIWSRRRIGEVTRDRARSGGPGRGKRSPIGGTFSAELEALGLSRAEVSRCEALAKVDEHTLRRHIDAIVERAERLSVRGTIAAVSHGASYDGDEWSTPAHVIRIARKLLGGSIGTDPATNASAQRVVRARYFFTRATNGLWVGNSSTVPRVWLGSIWLNPPYSRGLIELFVARWLEHAKRGRQRMLLLVNANTDSGWFQDTAARHPFALLRGRLRHELDGKEGGPARSGQAIFGANIPTRVLREGLRPIGLPCSSC